MLVRPSLYYLVGYKTKRYTQNAIKRNKPYRVRNVKFCLAVLLVRVLIYLKKSCSVIMLTTSIQTIYQYSIKPWWTAISSSLLRRRPNEKYLKTTYFLLSKFINYNKKATKLTVYLYFYGKYIIMKLKH